MDQAGCRLQVFANFYPLKIFVVWAARVDHREFSRGIRAIDIYHKLHAVSHRNGHVVLFDHDPFSTSFLFTGSKTFCALSVKFCLKFNARWLAMKKLVIQCKRQKRTNAECAAGPYILNSRSALPCAIRRLSAGVIGSDSRKSRASIKGP